MTANKHIFVMTGEVSGEAHAARMIAELKQLAPATKVTGIGGDNMRAAGADIFVDFAELAVMGLVEVLKRYRHIKAIFNQVVAYLAEQKPDLLILVDYPGFNLKLAKQVKKLGIPILYYISPKVWAWRESRIKKIKAYVDHMAVLFPFEVPIYQNAAVPVSCVGHPLVDAVTTSLTRQQAKQKFGLDNGLPVIGLFPGSRKNEVEALLAVMIESAELVAKQQELNVIVPHAQGLPKEVFASIEQSALDIKLIKGDFYQLTKACDSIVAASGTVTLEIALSGIPHFIVYKVAPLSYSILKRLVKIPYVGLCNIVTGKNTVLELLQDQVTAETLALELKKRLSEQSQQDAVTVQQQVLTALGPSGASSNAAKLVLSML